jgi:hypothetical protein
MPAKDERRELVPLIIASVVAVIAAFFPVVDLRSVSLGGGTA